MTRGRPARCPYCGQTKTVKKGYRKTKTMGPRRIRLCKACGRKFTPRNQKTIPPADVSAASQGTEPSESRDMLFGSDTSKPLLEYDPQKKRE